MIQYLSSWKDTKTECDMPQGNQLQINIFLDGVTEVRGPVDIVMYVCAYMNRLQTSSSVIQVDYKWRLYKVQKSAPLKRTCAFKVQGPSHGQRNDFSQVPIFSQCIQANNYLISRKTSSFQLI
jgi:hypothetical protein